MQMLSLNDLGSAQLSAQWADHVGEDRNVLVIKLDGHVPEALNPTETISWIQQQQIPTIGLGPAGPESPLADAFDLLITEATQLQCCLERIDQQPEAAAILTQVVSAGHKLPITDALALESMGYATLQSSEGFRNWLANRSAPVLTDIQTPVIISRSEALLEIKLNSPDNRNALSVAMRDALAEAFQLAISDPTLTQVSVTGSGDNFCSGGDLNEFGFADDMAKAHQIRQLRMPGRFVAMAPEKFHFHLHGGCVGAGIEMPAFATRITAEPDAWFQLPEVGFGLIPGAGGCVSIPRRIGRHRMNELAITGRRLTADEALHWGLIDGIQSSSQQPQTAKKAGG